MQVRTAHRKITIWVDDLDVREVDPEALSSRSDQIHVPGKYRYTKTLLSQEIYSNDRPIIFGIRKDHSLTEGCRSLLQIVEDHGAMPMALLIESDKVTVSLSFSANSS